MEFKLGQKWDTRMGKRFIIKEIREDDEYPLMCISMDTGKKYFLTRMVLKLQVILLIMI